MSHVPQHDQLFYRIYIFSTKYGTAAGLAIADGTQMFEAGVDVTMLRLVAY